MLPDQNRHIILRQQGIRKPPTETAEPYLGSFNLTADADVHSLNLETPTLDSQQLEDLRAQPDVASIAPEMPVHLIEPVSRSSGGGTTAQAGSVTWGITAVKADASSYTGSGVVVAVLDTGIDRSHPAFTGITVVEKDFTGEGNGDGNGHGTHCAGTIFGRDVDGFRIGVARGVEHILIGKVLDKDGGGSTVGVMEGLQWAINQGANVISMSLGISFPHYVESLVQQGIPVVAATSLGLEAYRATLRLFDAAVQLMNAAALANDRPILLIAASGNESEREGTPAYRVFTAPPAAADFAISVGAINEARVIAPFSNTKPTLVAPGVDIISAQASGGLVSFQGTSMAAPHVAGVAALYAEQLKDQGVFTLANFTANLVAGADQALLAPFDPIDVGAGLIQAP
jgi:subtilisin family serine protease